MYARFWGVRGSIPVSDPRFARYGGNTSCVEVRCGETVLVFDAGTGVRALGRLLVREDRSDLDLFLSHSHVDHVVGLPFFAGAYRPGNTLRVWSGHQAPGEGDDRVGGAQPHERAAPPHRSGGLPRRRVVPRLRGRRGPCPPRPALPSEPPVSTTRAGRSATAWTTRTSSICYVTDTEHEPDAPDESVLALVEGADLLIYDAMFTDAELPRHRGWGHSTWEEGARLCRGRGGRDLRDLPPRAGP